MKGKTVSFDHGCQQQGWRLWDRVFPCLRDGMRNRDFLEHHEVNQGR